MVMRMTRLYPWQGQKDSNPRHAVLETAALPTELYPYTVPFPDDTLRFRFVSLFLRPGKPGAVKSTVFIIKHGAANVKDFFREITIFFLVK